MSICCGSPAVTEGGVAGGLTCCGGSGSRIRALRPRPSAFLVIGNDLLCKLDVALGSSAVYIVENDLFPVAGFLCQADIPWDFRGEDLCSKVAAKVRGQLLR